MSLLFSNVGHLDRYQVIYVDPPWRYQNFGQKKHGAVRSHYPTMTVDQLAAVPVGDVADPAGCALVCWITAPKIVEGLGLMQRWGFRVVGKAVYWRKVYDRCVCQHGRERHQLLHDSRGDPLTHICGVRSCRCTRFQAKPYCGLGFYTRSGGEDCWLGIKGEGLTPDDHSVYEEVEAPVTVHSAKPPEVYERIEALWPKARKLELFARGEPRQGWSSWGNDAEGSLSDLELFGTVLPKCEQLPACVENLQLEVFA